MVIISAREERPVSMAIPLFRGRFVPDDGHHDDVRRARTC